MDQKNKWIRPFLNLTFQGILPYWILGIRNKFRAFPFVKSCFYPTPCWSLKIKYNHEKLSKTFVEKTDKFNDTNQENLIFPNIF